MRSLSSASERGIFKMQRYFSSLGVECLVNDTEARVLHEGVVYRRNLHGHEKGVCVEWLGVWVTPVQWTRFS